MANNMFVSGFSPPYMLRLSTRTWMRDSHDLFDYETHQQVKVSHFATSCALKLLRNDTDVSVVEFNNVVDKEHDHLLSIVCKRTGEYIIMPAEKMPGSRLYPQKLWLIVRTLPYQRYALQENDIIKLGRFRLRVKQLVPGSTDTSMSTGNGSDDGSESQLVRLFDGIIPDKTISFEEQCNMQCRICLAEGYLHNPNVNGNNSGSNTSNIGSNTNTPMNNEINFDIDTTTSKINSGSSFNVSNSNTSSITLNSDGNGFANLDNLSNSASLETDRLICACECKGSIKYVHVDCLRKWIDSRWNLKTDEPLPSMVFIREVSCELCKTNYPCFIRQNGELIQIVKMPKMSVPFLVLENITPHAIKGVHLLSMKDMKDLKLGRGHESDVRIPDVSISRYHATIRYEQGQFYLEDHDSKFGTLVAMRKPKMVSVNEPLSVQVGRSVINLSIDEKLPYVQNGYLTLSPPNPTNLDSPISSMDVATTQMPNYMGVGVGNVTNSNVSPVTANVNVNNNMGVVSGRVTMSPSPINTNQPLTPTGNRIGIDLLEYPVNSNGYLTFIQPYANQVSNVTPTLSSSNTPTNIITSANTGSNNIMTNVTGNIGSVSGSNGIGASTTTPTTTTQTINTNTNQNNTSNNAMNDLYWTYLRGVGSVTRPRYDSDTLDGLNTFRLNQSTSSNNQVGVNTTNPLSNLTGTITSMSNVMGNLGTIQNPVNTSNSNGDDIEMLLPDTVFIANWNNLPTRNVDLNVDTSTSALEHRHAGQDIDKPVTRI